MAATAANFPDKTDYDKYPLKIEMPCLQCKNKICKSRATIELAGKDEPLVITMHRDENLLDDTVISSAKCFLRAYNFTELYEKKATKFLYTMNHFVGGD